MASAFADDDGSADAELRAVFAVEPSISSALARRLRSTRLLAAVVADLDTADASGADASGAEKESHMAVVSMLNARGDRGLLAFTGTDSMARWDPAARPVPAAGRDIARSAIAEGALAVVIDVAGPHPAVVTGADLGILTDSLDLDATQEAVRSVLGALASTCRCWDARQISEQMDVIIEAPPESVDEAAALIAGSAHLLALVPGGIGVTTTGSLGPRTAGFGASLPAGILAPDRLGLNGPGPVSGVLDSHLLIDPDPAGPGMTA